MMQDKNEVLSNLLDIVNERAEEAEKELERLCKSSSSHSERSASNVSALSDASVGSDDVFLVPPSPGGTRDKHENDDDIINKDWEVRKRVFDRSFICSFVCFIPRVRLLKKKCKDRQTLGPCQWAEKAVEHDTVIPTVVGWLWTVLKGLGKKDWINWISE